MRVANVDNAKTNYNCASAKANSRGFPSSCMPTHLPIFTLILAQTLCWEQTTPLLRPIHCTHVILRGSQGNVCPGPLAVCGDSTPNRCGGTLSGARRAPGGHLHPTRDHSASAPLSLNTLTRAYPTSLVLKHSLSSRGHRNSTLRNNPHKRCRRRRTLCETRPRLHTYMRIAAPLASALHEQRQRS